LRGPPGSAFSVDSTHHRALRCQAPYVGGIGCRRR
jgi:hypothetical protein